MTALVKRFEDRLQSPNFQGFNSEDIRNEQDHSPIGDYQFKKGKVRDLLEVDNQLYLFHSDRLSAFDRHIGCAPFKGVAICAIADYWLQKAEAILPTHRISRPENRTLIVEPLKPLKVEVIVRGYLAGSMQRAYQNGKRTFCGVELEENLQSWQSLHSPIITPTTKAEVYEHDEEITHQQVVSMELCSPEQWKKICEYSLQLFDLGTKVYQQHGWILVDTKYEFGIDSQGTIKLIDEIHTPDSSRLWKKDSYSKLISTGKSPEMLDKENIRRFLSNQGFTGEGQVPHVPEEEFAQLSRVYFKVAQTLCQDSLFVGDTPKPFEYFN